MLRINFILFVIASILFSAKRLMRYLRYLQQDAYSLKRFVKWIGDTRAFDKRGSVTVIAAALVSIVSIRFALLIGAASLFGWFLWEKDPRKDGKLKLIMTSRAKRIFAVAFLLYATGQTLVCFLKFPAYWPAQILLFQAIPLFLAASVAILVFDERRRQKAYIFQAMKKLEEVSPFIIGITGSYGKTSTKDALSNILQVTLGPTFWPKKGTNTEMGITREIRNNLKKEMLYAVVEMGAYARGSIARLCQLTPPMAGIITTIGVAHLDRFGDREVIREAKSELAQAIPFDGILVCNGDNEGTRRIALDYPKKTTLLYGFDNSKDDLDCWIKEYSISQAGTDFHFQWRGSEYRGRTSLLGRMALSNLAACFAMACALGADPEFVIGAIANLKSVDNRLEMQQSNGITYLRDAYNSNPEGFADAIDVLEKFEAKKKFLMTPGMIELAALEEDLHRKIGEKAGRVCDYAIVVGNTNRESLTRGLLSGGMDEGKIIHVGKREEAFNELTSRLEPGDAVLIENDLPDLYQDRIRF